MAKILSHPNIGDYSTEETFDFPDGSSITLKCGEDKHLTYALAVFMCSDLIFRLHKMSREE